MARVSGGGHDLCQLAEIDMPDTMDGHWQALSDAFNEDQQEIQNRDDGDVEAELAKGDVLTAEYRAPYVAHAPLEPINATVLMTDDRIDIWTGTQIPRFIENNVAKLTDLSMIKSTCTC